MKSKAFLLLLGRDFRFRNQLGKDGRTIMVLGFGRGSVLMNGLVLIITRVNFLKDDIIKKS